MIRPGWRSFRTGRQPRGEDGVVHGLAVAHLGFVLDAGLFVGHRTLEGEQLPAAIKELSSLLKID